MLWSLTVVFSFLLVGHSVAQQTEVKIATYNIYFLDDGIREEREQNLQRVIRELDADIIGFQEINNPAALENILPEEYEIAMVDDPDEVQDLALAVRPPFRIESYRHVFPDPDYNDAFPRSRDLLQVEVGNHNLEFVVLVHHAKSRRGGRSHTDPRREAASKHIVAYIKKNLSGEKIILLGDFNDNPDDRSLNILEYGKFDARGGIDRIADTFLFNTTEELASKDYCSYGYSYIYENIEADTLALKVERTRRVNNKWRGKEYDFWDLEIKANLFDQILVSFANQGCE